MPPVKRAKGKNRGGKEELSEDYCFVCKDGGLLLVCEFKNCIKAYHPQCVGKDPTFLETAQRWICGRHSCFICHKSSNFHCFGCPSAVCKRCIKSAEFVHVRGKKGFCNNCLKLVLLIEENVDVDSDGGKIDFKDIDTYEFLFKDYWVIIKEKEGLTLEDLHSADLLLKKGENYKNGSDSDKLVEGEEEEEDPDCDDDMDDKIKVGPFSLMEGSKEAKFFSLKSALRKVKSKKREFIGWGSKSLIEFLASIGKDTSKPFSQFEVNDIIREYINENKLIHPERKKKVLCDAKLQSFFGRKSVNRNKIFDLLEAHFAENQEQSEDDELSYNSEEKEDGALKSCKRPKRMGSGSRIYKTEKVLEVPQSCFASITTKNIKLVYLKRSLIEDLLKNPETFDEKVMGSFVRIKSDPNDYFQKNSHQLEMVTGITKASGTGDIGTEVILQVSNIKKGIQICMLSDDDFSEEECEDLHQRVKDGLFKRFTIVELEQKARILHENITKHSIERELALLQNLIDRANEKGWRRELFEYLDRRQLLQTPAEQQRMLQEVPKVIAEEIEPEVASLELPKDEKLRTDDDSPRSILPRVFDDLKANGTSTNLTVRTTAAAEDDAVYHQISEKRTSEDLSGDEHGNGNAIDVQAVEKEAGIGDSINMDTPSEVKSDFAVDEEENRDAIDEQAVDEQAGIGDSRNMVAVSEVVVLDLDEDENGDDIVEEEAVENQAGIEDSVNMNCASEITMSDVTVGDEDAAEKEADIIVLDDDDDEGASDATANQIIEDPESHIWHYVDPFGDIQGPFSAILLKKWSDCGYFTPDFKVWKTGQTPEMAILLTDVLLQIFP